MNKTTKIIIGIIVAIVVVGGIWYGVSREQTRVPAEKVIKVGILAPFSGARAEAGEYFKKGLNLTLNEINSDKEKKYKISLIFEDTQYDPKIAVTTFNKLKDIDHVKYVVGLQGSSEVLAVAPIAEENKIILITPAAQSADISKAGDYIFRTQISLVQEAPFWAKFIATKINNEPLHVLVLNTDYGSSYLDFFTPALKENGGKLGVVEKVDLNNTDFRTQLLKIRFNNPNFVLLITTPKLGGQILKQAKELDIKSTFFATSPIEGEDFIKTGGEATEDILYPYPYNDSSNIISMKSYREKYIAKYNEKPEMLSANIYDTVNLLSLCFERIGDNVDKVKDCLYSIKDYQGASGVLSFDSNGDVVKPLIIKIVKNGQFVPYSE
jgi:branched-chain amino acid transport system substrate-binding protein